MHMYIYVLYTCPFETAAVITKLDYVINTFIRFYYIHYNTDACTYCTYYAKCRRRLTILYIRSIIVIIILLLLLLLLLLLYTDTYCMCVCVCVGVHTIQFRVSGGVPVHFINPAAQFRRTDEKTRMNNNNNS
jgi:hypothetical protein